MGCPNATTGKHLWLKYWASGIPRSWWFCHLCEKKRRPRHPRLWKRENERKSGPGESPGIRGFSPRFIILDEAFPGVVEGAIRGGQIRVLERNERDTGTEGEQA
jgi:hypothetical protein